MLYLVPPGGCCVLIPVGGVTYGSLAAGSSTCFFVGGSFSGPPRGTLDFLGKVRKRAGGEHGSSPKGDKA